MSVDDRESTRPRLVLPARTERVIVAFGAEEVQATTARVSSAVNSMSSADVVVNTKYRQGVELTAPVRVLRQATRTNTRAGEAESSQEEPRFFGHVVKAEPVDGELRISAESGRELSEKSVGILRTRNFPTLEMVHHIMKRGGFPDDRIVIQGFREPPLEVFVVELLVKGLSVSQRLSIGGVEFHPIQNTDGGPSLGPFAPEWQEIVTRWGEPSGRARTYVTASRIESAQTEGMERISAMLDALLAASVYGFSRDPAGRDLPYRRRHALARPDAIPVVFVQGAVTRRAVLEAIPGADLDSLSDASSTVRSWRDLLESAPPTHLRRALQALRDASDATRDSVERVHAISSALEHYASTARVPEALTRDDIKRVKHAHKQLPVSQGAKDRLAQLLGTANQAPLFARVRLQARQDGTPVTSDEWSLLTRLRRVRNHGVHGGVELGAEGLPDEDELRRGISLLSRLIMHQWARQTS